MNIHEFGNKIKGWAGERRQTLIFIAILAGTAVISFYMGYVARAETQSAEALNYGPGGPYTASQSLKTGSKTGDLTGISNTADAAGPAPSKGGPDSYVASKNGSKYYPADCSGASRIKDENKVFFSSETSALSAGYTLAANCN